MTNELTNRQMEIMDLVVKGYRNHEIAKELYISLQTVKNHLNNVYGFLNSYNRVDATIKYMRYINKRIRKLESTRSLFM